MAGAESTPKLPHTMPDISMNMSTDVAYLGSVNEKHWPSLEPRVKQQITRLLSRQRAQTSSTHDVESMVSVAYRYFLRRLKTYRPEKGGTFDGYFFRYLSHELEAELRRSNRSMCAKGATGLKLVDQAYRACMLEGRKFSFAVLQQMYPKKKTATLRCYYEQWRSGRVEDPVGEDYVNCEPYWMEDKAGLTPPCGYGKGGTESADGQRVCRYHL